MKKILTFTLVAVMALGLLTACGSSKAPDKKFEIVAGENNEMAYSTTTLDGIKKGNLVEVTLINHDTSASHTFAVTDFNFKSKPVAPGKTGVFTFTASKSGTIEFHCDVAGHKDGGMVGEMTVTP